MKGIKPFKLGLLSRPFQWGASHHLGVSVLGYFPFDPPGQLYTDMELWASITELLDPPVLDVGIPKSRAEVLVVGNAYAPHGRPTSTCPVRVRLGGIDKALYVIGDRFWNRGVPTEPLPFTVMPLGWQNAFGGEGYDKNPLGKGASPIEDEQGRPIHPLPNVETPRALIRSERDRPEPAGLGAVDFTWPQRFKRAGTYDKRWMETRYPGFAEDLDWRIWNMAAPDQQREEPFRGDEPFRIENMHPSQPMLEGRLPGVRARSFALKRVQGGYERFVEVPLKLTTVWLFPHAERGVLVFQGALPVAEDDATDVGCLMVAGERLGEPRPEEHYRAVMLKRMDPDNAVEVLNDADLMPPHLVGLGPEVDEATELTTPKGLRRKKMRERASAEIEASREHVASLGLDPDEHGPAPLPAEEPQPTLAELPEFVRQKVAGIEALRKQADAERKVRDAETEKFFEQVGLDYDVIREEKQTVPTGPPDFKADDYRDMLRRMADEAAQAGHPQKELEYYASDPEFYAKLQKYEQMALDGYRQGAHLQAPAPLRTGAESDALREEVERRFTHGESFAGWDLTGADLSEMDLAGARFAGALLEGVSFENANLQGADLSGAVLAHAVLNGAKLRGASFRGANMGKAKLLCVDGGADVDLSETILWSAELAGAQLSGANLEGAMMLEADLREADLSRASLPKVFFHETPLTGSRFVGAQATGAVFMKVQADGIDFGGACLEEAVFLQSAARGARFTNARMTNFRMVQSDAPNADFRGAILDRSNLRGADLTEADLSGASLLGAELSEAKARGARFYRAVAKGSFWMKTDLREAFLVGADLFEALMQKADIRGADFRGANLYGADFALVHSDDRTRVEEAIQLKVRIRPVRPPPGRPQR